MPFFPDRIRQAGVDESAYRVLDRRRTDEFIATAMTIVLRQRPCDTVERFSIADLEPAALDDKLRSLGIPNSIVSICWLRFHEALEIDWNVLSSHFTDFWYPSSDDVIVMPFDESWALEADHEEVATFIRIKPL